MPPKARHEGLVATLVDDELVVYDDARRRAHCLNATAAEVFRLCDGVRTVGEIAELLGAPADAETVEAALDELRTAELLEHGPEAGVSRRQALKRAGLAGTAALLAPAVASIALPAAARAQSMCGATGETCTTPEECCGNQGGPFPFADCQGGACCSLFACDTIADCCPGATGCVTFETIKVCQF